MQLRRDRGRPLGDPARGADARARAASTASARPAPDDPALQQVANVAHLPGILRFSLAMPDIHWGYGFPIGGVAAVDAERGRRLAGRRRLRHQLRRAGPHHRARGGGRSARSSTRSPPSSSATSPPAWARAGPSRGSPDASSTRSSPGARAGPCGAGFAAARDDAERCEEGGRLAGRRPGGGERAGARARRRPARHARQRQPLPRAGPGRGGLRRAGREAFGLVPGPGRGPDPLRVARPRLPGLRRVHRRAGAARVARFGPDYADLPDPQLACAPDRAAPLGQALPRRHAGGRQLRLGQPAGHDRPRGPRAAPRARHLRARPRRAPPLRRLPQRGEARGARGRRRAGGACSSTARARPAPSARATRASRRPTAPSASRCSSPATWGATPTCSPAPPRAMADTFGSSCHGAGPAPLARRGAAAGPRPLHRAGSSPRAASRSSRAGRRRSPRR